MQGVKEYAAGINPDLEKAANEYQEACLSEIKQIETSQSASGSTHSSGKSGMASLSETLLSHHSGTKIKGGDKFYTVAEPITPPFESTVNSPNPLPYLVLASIFAALFFCIRSLKKEKSEILYVNNNSLINILLSYKNKENSREKTKILLKKTFLYRIRQSMKL